MLPYQEKYIGNTREIMSLSNFYGAELSDFESWYKTERAAAERLRTLRQENIDLLDTYLFPQLDDLHNASPEDIEALEAFADCLMDWKTNLDCGVYVLIHDSLLSLYRIRRERNLIIKELYKLGMGLYYQNRMVVGIDRARVEPLLFRNEMVFTEGGSYLKFFKDIEDEETKGYIIRSLANIAICSPDMNRRVAISARVLDIVRDDYYRSLAPGLPWERFRQRTTQQMSSNRSILSKGNLSAKELATVLEACHEVFQPESGSEKPNIRWLWPYYEMEYSCGFVDLQTTLDRLETLIEETAYDQFDVSGLYGNVQLPVYYGMLLRENESLLEKPRYARFLSRAYEKMMRTLTTYPADKFDEHLFYNIRLVITDYFETEGVAPYREITTKLMQRFAGELYIRSRKAGEIAKCHSAAILKREPDFFDDIPFIRQITDTREKAAAVAEYAVQCGLYHDFGLIKMNISRLRMTRNLFEGEHQIWKLHTVSGYDDLRGRASTKIFTDVAFGHHGWYNGGGSSFPEDYIRVRSDYRQMTDVVAVASYIVDHFDGDLADILQYIMAQEGKRFSPLVTAYLGDENLIQSISLILNGEDSDYYREVYARLI